MGGGGPSFDLRGGNDFLIIVVGFFVFLVSLRQRLHDGTSHPAEGSVSFSLKKERC